LRTIDVEVDLIEELKEYARHVEFPIYVADGENAETIVDQGYDFNFVDYMNPLYKQYTDELNPYVIDFEKEGLEGVKGKLTFMFIKDENGGYCVEFKKIPTRDYSMYMSYFFGKGSPYIRVKGLQFLSQDGILLKKSEGLENPVGIILPLWIKEDSIFYDVNLEDESKLDLTLDRNDVVTNSKFNNLTRKIEKIIIDHIEKILTQKYIVTDRDKNRFMEIFFKVFSKNFSTIPDFFLERLKELVIFECSVNGEIKYHNYNELKGSWKYFYLIKEIASDQEAFVKIVKKTMEKAFTEDPIIHSPFLMHGDLLPKLLLEFSGDHVIVTNKELGHSFDKILLVPSVEKRDKKGEECGLTFEGDYKNCFGTLATTSYRMAPNINHPFMRLVNKNIDKFSGEDKRNHEYLFYILFSTKVLVEPDIGLGPLPLKEIQRIQKCLLDIYVEKGLLTQEEAERYILTEKDFCPYDMGEDFLK
jgi:hypothetical protein